MSTSFGIVKQKEPANYGWVNGAQARKGRLYLFCLREFKRFAAEFHKIDKVIKKGHGLPIWHDFFTKRDFFYYNACVYKQKLNKVLSFEYKKAICS